MASMQSQIDKHVRQARQAQASSSSRRDRSAFAAHADDSDEIAYTTFVADNAELYPAVRDRQYHSAHPRPLDVHTFIESV